MDVDKPHFEGSVPVVSVPESSFSRLGCECRRNSPQAVWTEYLRASSLSLNWNECAPTMNVLRGF